MEREEDIGDLLPAVRAGEFGPSITGHGPSDERSTLDLQEVITPTIPVAHEGFGSPSMWTRALTDSGMHKLSLID